MTAFVLHWPWRKSTCTIPDHKRDLPRGIIEVLSRIIEPGRAS